ncbi:MAG: extracellular solute-binding protein [Spirochaetaceae bacterium]|nr:extracellular solute-binding protein [Spirochaetaceae bacterium]
MKKFRVLAIMLMLILVSSLTFAGGKGESNSVNKAEKPKLVFAHAWGGGDAKASLYVPFAQSYADANKENVDIEVLALAGQQEYVDVMKTRLAAGELPDIFLFWPGEGNLRPFADAGKLLAVDDFSNYSSTVFKKDMIDKSLYSICQVDGVTDAIPIEQFKGFWLANKDLFDKFGLKIPTTYAELKEVSKVFVKNGIVPINMGSKGGNPGHFMFNALSYQLSGGIQDALTMAENHKFDTPANREAAKLLDEMRKLGMFPKDTIANGDWGPAVNLYNQEKAAMVYCFPWKIGDVKPEIAAKSVFFHTPALSDATIDVSKFAIGGQSMALLINKDSFNDSAKKDELVKLADYLLSDKMFKLLAKTGNMPAKNVKISDTSSYNPLFVGALNFTSTLTNSIQPMWGLFPDPSVHTVYIDGLDQLFAGIITADEFIKQVQTAFDNL